MKQFPKKSIVAMASAVMAFSAFALWTKVDTAEVRPMQAPEAVAAAVDADDDAPVFYGQLEWTDQWGTMGTGVYNYGVYSFTLDGGEPTWISGDRVPHSTGGGFYYDGAYHGNTSTQNPQRVATTTFKYDARSWKNLAYGYYEVPPSDTYSNSMAYDYTTGKAYALGLTFNQNGVTYLRDVNLETGEMTNIAQLDRGYNAIACDGDGQLWAFYREPSFPNPTSLYKLDKQTGKGTLVGPLGYNQKGVYSAAAVDLRTGKLYWQAEILASYNEHYEETYASYVMEIDKTTGKATPVKKFQYEQVQFASLYFMDSHPKAPDGVKDLKFAYKTGEFSKGNVTCQLPTTTYDRTPLTGKLSVEVYLDSVKTVTATGLTPGTAYTTDEITLKDGSHTVWVYCYNDANQKSIRSDVSFYGGSDAPESVKNLQMTYTPDHKQVTLTWDAPVQGANNGKLDTSSLRYTVVRSPNEVVAKDITECTFSESPDVPQALTQYAVYATSSGGTSKYAYSDQTILGQSRDLPYLQTFDSNTDFLSMFTLDPQNLAQENGQYWMWQQQLRLAIYFLSYGNRLPVDGWLITPSLNLKKDYIYRVSYQTECFAGGGTFKKQIDIHLGQYPTLEGMKRMVASNSFAMVASEREVATNLIRTQENDAFVGFHATSNDYDHVSLDNIRIEEYGPVSIPAAPEFVSSGSGDGIASVTVRIPTLDAAGKPAGEIKNVHLYTSDLTRRVGTTAVEKGQTEVTVVDLNPSLSLNHYAVVAENESGNGLDLQVTVNMRPDVPKEVENLVVGTGANGRNAVISWKYPADMLGVDGNKLTEGDLSYDIYRSVSYMKDLVKTVNGSVNSVELPNVLEDYPDDQQKIMTYSVVARTLGGSSKEVGATALFGPAFELPLNENFADGSQFKPWQSKSTNCSFYPISKGSNPSATPTEGKVLTFSPSYESMCSGQYISPRVNLSGLENPKFTFSFYGSTNTVVSNAKVRIGLIVEKDGVEQPMQYISAYYPVKAEEDGWQTHTVDLSDYARYGRASIVLYCENDRRNGCIHFDKLEMTGDKPTRDVRMIGIEGPSQALMGRNNEYFITVANNGSGALTDVKVELSVEDEVVGSETVDLAVDEEKTVSINYSPTLKDMPRTVYLTATASVEGDGNIYNNTENLKVDIVAPNVPYVTDLKVFEDLDGAHLTWSDADVYPGEVEQTDNIESYPDFAISNLGDWTLYDEDKATTMSGLSNGTTTYKWDNIGLPQAYIVFNPQKVGVGSTWKAHSGEKFLASFTSSSGENNDWLVSPALSGHEQVVSFYAAAFMGFQNMTETFDFMVSSSGNEVSDFKALKSNVVVRNSNWTKFSYTVPAGTRYFAIVCKSKASWALMLDDITFIPEQPSVEFTGYNVYRNGEKFASEIGETEYVDKDVTAGETYDYNVTANYTEGESIFSNTVSLKVAAISGTGADECMISTVPGAIVVKAPENAPVTVHTLDGKCIYQFASTGYETLSVVPGIYIVRAGTATAKLLVK